MASLVLLFLSALLVFSGSATKLEGEETITSCGNCCMPWFIKKTNDAKCTCGSSLNGIVNCNNQPNLTLSPCYCMTADGAANETVVGACPYTCIVPGNWYSNITELNYHMCNETWKRTGRLCSQCIDGYGPLVYSYSMECIPCSPGVVGKSIALFLASFLPLTAFCLIIIILRVSGPRPPMSTFILVSQVMSAPQYMLLTFAPIRYKSLYIRKHIHDICLKLFATFFGLWNLDIGRAFYPHICLSPNMSTLQAQFLEYVIALFPLAILLAVAVSVKLYNGGNRIIFWVCRPVYSCLAHFRRTIDIRTSLIDAFATFIILSQNKIGYTSFRILQPVNIFSPNKYFTVSAYLDPTHTYFGSHHVPYTIPALILSILFILIPLLLLFLYPLKSFQTFLNNHRWQCLALHIFADTFQGCYKNGTDGSRDYRWFAGLHLFMRFAIVAFYDVSRYEKFTIVFMIISTSLYMAILAAFQPYKKHIYLKLDMILLFGLLLWSIAVMADELGFAEKNHFDYVLHLNFLILCSLIPFVYISGLVIYWLLVIKKLHTLIIIKLRQVFYSKDHIRLLT